MTHSMRAKIAIFWILIFTPLVILLLFVVTPVAVLYPMHSQKNVGSLIGPSVEKKILSWKRRSYAATSNVWQRYCTEYDEDLLYIPQNGPCRFANVEYDTYVTFDRFARLDVVKQHRTNILVIGDSFAMGWGVNDTDTFAYHLEQQLNVNVVNAAVSSYGTARQFQYVTKFLRRKYDLIIVQYCNNDLGENLNFLNHSISQPRPKSLYEGLRVDEPLKIPSIFRLALNTYVQLFQNFQITDLWRPETIRVGNTPQSGPPVNPPQDKNDWSVHEVPFLEILRLFKGQLGNPPILVTYANSHNMQFINFPGGPTDDDIHFLPPQLTERDYFLMDAHMNEAGHAHLAESLREYVALHFNLSSKAGRPASTTTD